MKYKLRKDYTALVFDIKDGKLLSGATKFLKAGTIAEGKKIGVGEAVNIKLPEGLILVLGTLDVVLFEDSVVPAEFLEALPTDETTDENGEVVTKGLNKWVIIAIVAVVVGVAAFFIYKKMKR